jgi:quercetin dioxygenase-like cupin family protein
MKIGHVDQLEATQVQMEGAKGVRMRIVIGEPQGAPNFVMRVFDVEAGGHSPHHTHGFEHEVFVLGGKGTFVEEGRESPLGPGDVVFVAPNALHQFRAAPDQGLRFICVVPKG